MISPGEEIIRSWFGSKGWTPFDFQSECWHAYLKGKDGLLNAPTGSGKTFALWMPLLIEWINTHPDNWQSKMNNGLQIMWITPLRALTKDIRKALSESAFEIGVPWLVKSRTGDTSNKERAEIKRKNPEVIITTPESLHLMLSNKDYERTFRNLKAIVVDEWHELMGGKRGVQVELALSRLRAINPTFRTWGISATIGNLPEALEVLTGAVPHKPDSAIVKANLEKELRITSILPDTMEKYPWSGHLGIRLIDKIIPILEQSKSTLVFINTRAQTEIWYRTLLEKHPDFAGQIALHHGSLDRKVRDWVETALHEGQLKVVVCTSSLDLGVDFDPVETIVQVGSPKGVARFLQRAGRSGHRPGVPSIAYFLPTNALELIEAAALKEAIEEKFIEEKPPMELAYDVLLQYMITLAVSEGFDEKQIFEEVKRTFAYHQLSRESWEWMLDFLVTGGDSLGQYDEYHKVIIDEQGKYRVTSRRLALMHRLSIGTIVSEPLMRVQMMRGAYLGTLEEGFISRLKTGDNFWFAGRSLTLAKVKDMTALVKLSKSQKGLIPSWAGGRMPLSSKLAFKLRQKLDNYTRGIITDIEIEHVKPILELQAERSAVPNLNQLLIEKIQTPEGYHLFFYPFVGRAVHEGLSSLIALRLSLSQPITFSIAMNDYGFELLSDTEVDIENAIENGLFSLDNLESDINQSANSNEMAKRKFREIAQISGLLFTGYPGKGKKDRHLQASSSLLFDVFKEHDPENLLLRQAYYEVFTYQLDEKRMAESLELINTQEIVIKRPKTPTPFGFPILIDRRREKITSEKIEDIVRKLQLQYIAAQEEE